MESKDMIQRKKCIRCGVNYTIQKNSNYCHDCMVEMSKPRPCKCGCGEIIYDKDWRVVYIKGHNYKKKIVYNCPPRLCACGCGEYVTNPNPKIKYIQNHNFRKLSSDAIARRSKTTHEKWLSKSKEEKEKFGLSISNAYSKKTKEDFEIIQSKIKNTNLKKFGKEYYTQTDIGKERFKNTCLQKFGETTNLKCQETKDKIKKTNLERYGVEYCTQNKEVQQKIKSTMLKEYGGEYAFCSQTISQKIHQTMLDRYGFKYTMQCKELRDKTLYNNIQRYGYAYPNLIKIRCNYYDSIISNNEFYEPLFSKDEYSITGFCRDDEFLYKYRCKKCHNEYVANGNNRCPVCYPKYISYLELIIRDFLDKNNIKYERNNRNILQSKKELDFYLPDYKIAIECNGNYWHNETILTDKRYHYQKMIDCDSKGIRLISFFEDEFVYKKDILLSMLSVILNVNCTKIYARKCKICCVDDEQLKKFLNENHIQGYVNSVLSYGLYYNNELVSVMTFGHYRKSMGRKKVNNEYELLRFCSKKYTVVVGGASKLFKYFLNCIKPQKIISYCDRRFSSGNLYKILGFVKHHDTDVGYSYINTNNCIKRYNRFLFTKYKLKKMFDDYDESKSQYQIMLDHNYVKIYDCGQSLYVFDVG